MYLVLYTDVNKDGKSDIIVANEFSANVSVLINDGAGNFAVKKDYQAGSGPYMVQAADFTGDGNVDLLVCLNKDSTVALLTNNGPLLEEALRHELAEVGGTFDELLLSWRLEATKPDPAAFAAAAAVLDLTPDQLFLVDDDPANVEAALAAEWHAHRYTDTINLRLALARAGIN